MEGEEYRVMGEPAVTEKTQETTQQEAEELSSTAAIQRLLYEHPLFAWERTEEREREENAKITERAAKEPDGAEGGDTEPELLDVLCVGTGPCVRSFLDVCLQAGQMEGKLLRILSLSPDPASERERYLQDRPAMAGFVRIDKASLDDPYAVLDFGKLPGDEQEIRELVASLQSESPASRTFRYAFVDGGDDAQSRELALLLRQILPSACEVAAVCRDGEEDPAAEGVDPSAQIWPVFVREAENFRSPDHELGRMAFNAHLVWDDTLNMDLADKRYHFFDSQEPRDLYNFRSSLALVLSLRYKLHSIEIDETDPMRAAKAFSRLVLERLPGAGEENPTPEQRRAQETYDRLLDLEHRRWVLDRAADGWKAPRRDDGSLDLESCARERKVKIERKTPEGKMVRTHPCMVRGSARRPLSGELYRDRRRWDDEVNFPIDPGLDELDQMSIALHRQMRREAEETNLRKYGLHKCGPLKQIRKMISAEQPEVYRALQQYCYALQNIILWSESYARQYGGFEKALLEAVRLEEAFSDEKKQKIEDEVKSVRRQSFPLIESCLYRDYKDNDRKLIDRIPFILTWHFMDTLALGFADGRQQNGRNEPAFADVASATVLCPQRIVYLYCFTPDSSVDLLASKLDAVLGYLGRRKVHCGVDLCIACVGDPEQMGLPGRLQEVSSRHERREGRNVWLSQPVIREAGNEQEAMEIFSDYLQETRVDLFDAAVPIFPFATDNGEFLQRVREKRRIPFCEFDWRARRFSRWTHDCAFLQYLHEKSFLRIRDMFALMNAQDTAYNIPVLEKNYRELWEIYTGSYLQYDQYENGIRNWNNLCSCLAGYESWRRQNRPMARIDLPASGAPVQLVCTVHSADQPKVRTLFRALAPYGILIDRPQMQGVGTSRQVTLTCRKSAEPALRKVLGSLQSLSKKFDLLVEEDLSVDRVTGLRIIYDDPKVTKARLNVAPHFSKYLAWTLQALCRAGFIDSLEINWVKETADFSYTSPQIKRLLTSAGQILEVYAYYEALKTGYFDDVATGFTFRWERDEVQNELDLVLTKDFHSLFVECKAVANLQLDYYHKLDSIANQFGIGTVKILLGNTYRRHHETVNSLQRSRGKQLMIRTISDPEQIENIGQELQKIMEEEIARSRRQGRELD